MFEWMRSARKKESLPDPTTFSRHPSPSEELSEGSFNDCGKPIKKGEGGERFHLIDQNPVMQQFVARIFKPFIPVSDVVRIGNSFYSYEPKIKGIERKTSDAEVQADIAILHMIFGDYDHEYQGDFFGSSSINIKREAGRHMLFDFGRSEMLSEKQDVFLTRGREVLDNANLETLYITKEKLEQMLKDFESDAGALRVEAAFKATGQTISELFPEAPHGTTFQQFFQRLLESIHVVHELTQSYISQKS